jgi:hypothetical protein
MGYRTPNIDRLGEDHRRRDLRVLNDAAVVAGHP